MPYLRALTVVALSLALPAALARAQSPPPTGSSDPAPPPSSWVRMETFSTLAAFLNLASGTVRLVAILSPSSPASAAIMETIGTTLRSNPSRRLRAYVVFSHLSTADSEMRALNHAAGLRDRRLIYLWDANAVTAGVFRSVPGSTTEPATDLCMIYDTDARVADPPPAPVLWMSGNPRLGGPRLEATRFADQANALVRRVEARAGEPSRSSH
jgi:hypothetical protein